MNHEDVIQLAREAGFVVDEDSRKYQPNCISHTWYLIDEGLECFATAIEQRTLERAAVELENEITQSGENVAAAIRALKAAT